MDLGPRNAKSRPWRLSPSSRPGIRSRANVQSRIRQSATLPAGIETLAKRAGQIAEDGEHLFARPAFYAEFAPLENHSNFVDSIYVLKDRGLLTASRLAFASPFKELAFSFPESAQGSAQGSGHRVVVNEPNFGHRKKSRAFFGWIIGIKFKPTWSGRLCTEDPVIVACQNSLACVIGTSPSCLDVLDPLDQALLVLSQQIRHDSIIGSNYFETSHDRVSNLASHVGRSVRTLHRRMRTSTGFPPKRFLAVQRFRRSVYEIATENAELSLIAFDLGFSDQAHLTREFQRHAGVSPSAFKQAWRGRHGRAVRFLQDAGSSARLRMAVWPA
jgi:AraC-like DNA-binding protein